MTNKLLLFSMMCVCNLVLLHVGLIYYEAHTWVMSNGL